MFGMRRLAWMMNLLVILQAISAIATIALCVVVYRSVGAPSVAYSKDFITVYDPAKGVLYVYDETLGEAVARYRLSRPGEKLERPK